MYDEPKEYPDDIKKASSKLPLGEQEKALVALHDSISELTSRLKPILTPRVEADGNAPSEDRGAPMQSPLADQLDSNNSSIRKASDKLHLLIEHLEC